MYIYTQVLPNQATTLKKVKINMPVDCTVPLLVSAKSNLIIIEHI